MIWRVPFKNNLKVTYLQSLEIPDYWVLTKLTGFALLDDLRVGWFQSLYKSRPNRGVRGISGGTDDNHSLQPLD